MTNLDLAHLIADAVWKAAVSETGRTPADAVLDVLHETGTGFCQYSETETGETLYQAMDDDADRMQAQAMKSVAEHQRGLFAEQEQP